MADYCLDIETLGTPENSGYGIVIPNYAIVKIPENLSSELEWMYFQLPIQEQLNKGLKVDAKTLDFWFNVCAQEFPLSLCEMQKSFTMKTGAIHNSHNIQYNNTYDIPSVLKLFLSNGDSTDPIKGINVYGNGCHFDCSILQENHRVLFGDANLWHYTAPDNVLTLRGLLTYDEEQEMKDAVQPFLDAFCDDINSRDIMFDLCLHNPLYDAAKEALFVSHILSLKKST